MTIQIVKEVLTDFMTSKGNEVAAITGAWGVGKTFAWGRLMVTNKSRIPFDKYAYVSLFGLNSVAEMRTAVFLKTRPVSSLGVPLTASEINKNWLSRSWSGLKQSSDWFKEFLKQVPNGQAISVGIDAVAPFFIRNMIVCLDDLERTDIATKDVLGFVSELKEEKGCKVVLIFNAAKLNGIETYRGYKEKVVDLEVAYSPTVTEAFDIVIDKDFPRREQFLGRAMALELTNVRVLRRTRDLLARVMPVVAGLHEDVVSQVVSTTILVCWSSFSPEEDHPGLRPIEAWNGMLYGSPGDQAKTDPKIQEWATKLRAYGMIHVDELDRTVARVVETGFVAGSGLELAAKTADERRRRDDTKEAFNNVWARFWGTFSDDPTDFPDSLFQAASDAIHLLRCGELGGSVSLLRELKRDDLADQLISKYVATHKGKPEAFNLKDPFYVGQEFDPAMVAAFGSAMAESKMLPTLHDSIMFMVEHSGWNPEHVEAMKAASVDDYEQFFLHFPETTGLSEVMKWTLEYNPGGAEVISERVRAALQKIKATNSLNAIRASRFGI